MDKSGERSGVICTRGATNGGVVVDLSGSTVYIRPQNDKAALKMADDICANTNLNVKRVQIAAPHKEAFQFTSYEAPGLSRSGYHADPPAAGPARPAQSISAAGSCYDNAFA